MKRAALAFAALAALAGCASVKFVGTPLEKAIAKGDLNEVETLLKQGADPNRKDLLTRISPSCRAVRKRRPDILKSLIAHGANIHKESDALYCAVDTGQLDVVKWLVEQGSPVPTLALLRAQDHQPEILAYLRGVKEDRAARAAPAPPTQAPAPAPQLTSTYVPFNVPTRPADLAVVFAESGDDARAATAHLIALGYPQDRLVSLSGTAATRAALAKELEGRLPKDMTPNSTIFVYFAGRAASLDGKQYLLGADGDASFPEQTGYPVAGLIEKVGKLGSRLAVVALDAPVTLDGAPAAPALYAIAASAGSRGDFSKLFFEGLDGAAKGANDVVTLGSIADFIAGRSAAPSALPSRQRLAEVVLH